MTHNKLRKVRKLAMTLVLANLALISLLALVLPETARSALPVLALMLPLLSASAIEAALSKEAHDRVQTQRVRSAQLSLRRALHQAA